MLNTKELALTKAISLLKEGKLVAFPTETVYGLGADATNEQACRQIFSLKNRPTFNPLIIHVSNLTQAANLGILNSEALRLIQVFWPGPLTIVVPVKADNGLAPAALAGLNSVALRMPSHPLALELISKAQHPIAAPSANISGKVSGTESAHIVEDFQDSVYVLENNSTMYGLESTIVDLTLEIPVILRLGFITAESISEILGLPIQFSNQAIKAPGMLLRHYSPLTPLRLNATDLKAGEIGLGFGVSFGNSALTHPFNLNLSEKADLTEAAANLYKSLRVLDKLALANHLHTIAVAPVTHEGIGAAINDRLKRAAHRD